MKQSKLILIAMLSGIFLLLGGVLIWGIFGLGLGRNQRTEVDGKVVITDYTKVLDVEVPVERIEALNLFFDKNSNDIYFYESDTEQIRIEEYVNRELPEKEKTKVTEANGTLTIDSPKRHTGIFYLGFNNKHGYVNVYLPASYQGDLCVAVVSGDIDTEVDFLLGSEASFSASSTSGNISLLKVEAKMVDISSVSGELDLKEIWGDATLTTTSGNIEMLACEGDCTVNTVSGEIQIGKVKGFLDLATTSGNIEIAEAFGGAETSTVSGDTRLQFAELSEDLDISTTSGEVQIYLPKGVSVNFDASTTSGEIQTFFDDVLSFNKKGNQASGSYGDAEKVNLKINTTSGDVVVRQK